LADPKVYSVTDAALAKLPVAHNDLNNRIGALEERWLELSEQLPGSGGGLTQKNGQIFRSARTAITRQIEQATYKAYRRFSSYQAFVPKCTEQILYQLNQLLRFSNALVRAVTERGFSGVFTPAKPDCSGLIRVVLQRRERRALVGAITEGLLGGLAAGAPPISFPGLDVDGERGLAGNDGIGHGENS